ncbi:MAG: penicillin-binding transpeptidase domain-containing protein, partial [Acidimicrobiia bacterium]
MNDPIRNLATSLFVVFAVLVAGVSWTQAVAGTDYRDDPRNARLVTARAARERGPIITRDGTVVAESFPDPDDPQVFRRSYPENELYGHVVGYATFIFGATALESARSGDLVSDRDATISGVLNAVFGGDLRPNGLRLTIDHALQTAAATALGGQQGAIVALDPRTGEILALVSSPRFDPNMLGGSGAGPTGDALVADEARPLLNRALRNTYAPGSTFKIVTTIAALESGLASEATAYPDPSRLTLPGSTAVIRNFDGGVCADGTDASLAEAFIRSCNTIFGQIGLDVGAAALTGAAQNAGFNLEIPLEIGVIASAIPSADDFENDLPGVAQTALGQRDVQATPLQMALIAAGAANGGEIMVPYLVAEVFSADAEVVERTEPQVWRRAMNPSTAVTLVDLMERVVTAGTGSRAAVP